MNDNALQELDEFIAKTKKTAGLDQQVRATFSVDEQVLKGLYREVLLNISPLIEELRERVNFLITFNDMQINPKQYTEVEREHAKIVYEAIVEKEREFLRRGGPQQ